MKALVTGATGFIGRALLERLEDPAILARNPERARASLGDVRAWAWDSTEASPPAESLEGVDTVFHLAGESIVASRWTAEFKRRIRESRVAGTRHLVNAIAAQEPRPRVLVSTSAIGVYGDRADEVITEASTLGEGFLAEVCEDWEKEALRAEEFGVRVVLVRIGIVLEQGGGALQQMLLPFKLGVGGSIGLGGQWMSWIHRGDLVDLLLHCANTDSVRGPVNGVAPNPVTNREFTRHLARTLRRPALLPVPPFMLRIIFGEAGKEFARSVRALPEAATSSGFEFRYPELPGALAAILRPEAVPSSR